MLTHYNGAKFTVKPKTSSQYNFDTKFIISITNQTISYDALNLNRNLCNQWYIAIKPFIFAIHNITTTHSSAVDRLSFVYTKKEYEKEKIINIYLNKSRSMESVERSVVCFYSSFIECNENSNQTKQTDTNENLRTNDQMQFETKCTVRSASKSTCFISQNR